MVTLSVKIIKIHLNVQLHELQRRTDEYGMGMNLIFTPPDILLHQKQQCSAIWNCQGKGWQCRWMGENWLGGPIKWHYDYPHPSVRAWLMLHCRWHVIENKSPRPLPANDRCAANVSRLLTNTPRSWTVFHVSCAFAAPSKPSPNIDRYVSFRS